MALHELPAATDSAVASIMRDIEFFEATFGSMAAARARVSAQDREVAALRARVTELLTRLKRVQRDNAALRVRFGPQPLIDYLKREFVCLGSVNLLQSALERWHEGKAGTSKEAEASPPVFLVLHAAAELPKMTAETVKIEVQNTRLSGVANAAAIAAQATARSVNKASRTKTAPVPTKKTAKARPSTSRTKSEECDAEKPHVGTKRKRRRRRQRSQSPAVISLEPIAVKSPMPAEATPARPEKRARVSMSPSSPSAGEQGPPSPRGRTRIVAEVAAAKKEVAPTLPIRMALSNPTNQNSAGRPGSKMGVPSDSSWRPEKDTAVDRSTPPLSPSSSSPQTADPQNAQAAASEEGTTSSSPCPSEAAPADLVSISSTSTGPKQARPTSRRTRAATGKQQPTSDKAKTASDILVKQIIEWPSDRRKMVNMKQSAMFLRLHTIQALEAKEPWNDMFLHRPRYALLFDPETLDDRGKKWLKATLRAQFVLRREFWERLHWLPISETVCVGVEWAKYRKARLRRASYAARTWRKLYEESIDLMAAGVLRDDVWCDPALWYMPASAVPWLPKSENLVAELEEEDYENPSRSYFTRAPSWHPVFQDSRFAQFTKNEFELPAFSPLQLVQEDTPTTESATNDQIDS